MTHPDDQQWIALAYGECDRTTEASLTAHLGSCESCREQLQQWRDVMGQLDTWREPDPRSVRRSAGRRQVVARLVVATSLFLAVGFVVGRATVEPVDVARLRTQIEASLRNQMPAIVQAELERTPSDDQELVLLTRQEANQAVAEALVALREDRQAVDQQTQFLLRCIVAGQTALRRDLETVAVEADKRIRFTHTRVDQLATQSAPRQPPGRAFVGP